MWMARFPIKVWISLLTWWRNFENKAIRGLRVTTKVRVSRLVWWGRLFCIIRFVFKVRTEIFHQSEGFTPGLVGSSLLYYTICLQSAEWDFPPKWGFHAWFGGVVSFVLYDLSSVQEYVSRITLVKVSIFIFLSIILGNIWTNNENVSVLSE